MSSRVPSHAPRHPAARAALCDDDPIDKTPCGHDTMRVLLAQVDALNAGDEGFDALLRLLPEASG